MTGNPSPFYIPVTIQRSSDSYLVGFISQEYNYRDLILLFL